MVRSGTLSRFFIPIYYANEGRLLSAAETMRAGTEGGIIWVMLGFPALSFVWCLARSYSIGGSLNSKVGHAKAPGPRRMSGENEVCWSSAQVVEWMVRDHSISTCRIAFKSALTLSKRAAQDGLYTTL